MTGTLSDQDRLPIPGAGFVWETVDRATVLRPDTEMVRAAFTTRIGGRSEGPFASWNVSYAVGDAAEAVAENRERASRTVERAGAASWGRIRQVHGNDVVRWAPDGDLRPADAVWTDDPDHVVAVFGADCVPILLRGAERVGCAHAGWRGLVAGVVEAAVEAVEATEVWIGPGIGPCCYEVDEERAAVIGDRFGPDAMRDRFANLWHAAKSAAVAAGVERVHSADLCTSCHAGVFFSHRRDRGVTGRQALVAHA